MTKVEQRNNDFYTDEGLKALEARIKSLISIYNNNDLPFREYCLGFGKLSIDTKEELFGRIKEMSDLIGFVFRKEREFEKMSDGTVVEKEVIK